MFSQCNVLVSSHVSWIIHQLLVLEFFYLFKSARVYRASTTKVLSLCALAGDILCGILNSAVSLYDNTEYMKAPIHQMVFPFLNHIGVNHILVTNFWTLWAFHEFRWAQPYDTWRSSACSLPTSWHEYIYLIVMRYVPLLHNGLQGDLKVYVNNTGHSRTSYLNAY